MSFTAMRGSDTRTQLANAAPALPRALAGRCGASAARRRRTRAQRPRPDYVHRRTAQDRRLGAVRRPKTRERGTAKPARLGCGSPTQRSLLPSPSSVCVLRVLGDGGTLAADPSAVLAGIERFTAIWDAA